MDKSNVYTLLDHQIGQCSVTVCFQIHNVSVYEEDLHSNNYTRNVLKRTFMVIIILEMC